MWGRRSGLLSKSHAELPTSGPFPFLGASASRIVEAALLFLPPSEGESLFSSSLSLSSATEERVLSSDVMSKAPLRQGPLRTPLAFRVAFFAGALIGRRHQHLC